VSRGEAINALIESGMELRQDDIELGRKLEQGRIIELLTRQAYASRTLGCRDEADTLDFAISLIKAGEND
jgi:hypothetical protein